jgi:uncharacterized protein (DUF2062 family)
VHAARDPAMTRLRRQLRRWLPDPVTLRAQRGFAWMGPLLDRPWLWRVNRVAIARGLAIGMFFGFLLPFGQGVAAGALAIGLRANLPAAVLATFVSNPLTTPAILVAAYYAGLAVLREPMVLPALALDTGWIETIKAMGVPLLVGLPLLAVFFTVLTYFGVQLVWRVGVLRKRAARRAAAAR